MTKPNIDDPKHDLSLTDADNNVIDMMLVDTLGRKDPRALQVGQVEPTAIKFTQGQGSYDDMTPPWMVAAQEDWSGGRGSKELEKDRSRFSDSYRANTWREGALMLGPMETYSKTADYESQEYMPGDTLNSGVSWSAVYGIDRYRATAWTQKGSWQCDAIWEFMARKVGNPAPLAVELHSDDGSKPGGTLRAGSYSGANHNENEGFWVQVDLTTNYDLQDVTDYWIMFYSGTEDNEDNHWEIGGATGTVLGRRSTNASTWASGEPTIYYRVLEAYSDSKNEEEWVFLEYKSALYAYGRWPYSAAWLWINGDRGVADASGVKTNLVDATKSWDTDEWEGCYVKIIEGPGSEEEQPWRKIVSNTSTTLIVDGDWYATITGATNYVITGSKTWKSVMSLGTGITDHAVTEDYIYFAGGESGTQGIKRYEWYNSSAVEADRTNEWEILEATYLLPVFHPDTKQTTLYLGCNYEPQYGSVIGKMQVPGTHNDLSFKLGRQLVETNTPWADHSIAYVTNTTKDHATKIAHATGFGTGVAAVKMLSTPVDITEANQIGFWIKSLGTDNVGDYQLLLTDFSSLEASPFIIYSDNGVNDLLSKFADGDDDTYESITWVAAEDKMYFLHSEKFDTAYFLLGTNNTEVSTMTAEYFNGWKWTALTINTSDIESPVGTTLGADGVVTFTPPQDWAMYTMVVEDPSSTFTSYTGYAVRFIVSADLTVPTTYYQSYVDRTTQHSLDLPVLTGVWEYVVIDITPEDYPLPDDSIIQQVSFNVAVNPGYDNILLRGGIDLLYDTPKWKPVDGKITGLELYRPNDNEPRSNPIIFTETLLYEMQAQNDDSIVPFRISELEAFQSEKTGRVHCVNGPYLYFTVGEEKLERYYNNNLDDIGPDTDEGLPSGRRGTITALLSYPGYVFAAVSTPNNTSSILRLKGSSWHEVYRAPRVGAKTRNLYYQTIPGDAVGRLWFDQSGEILYIPVVSGDPREADSYQFTHEGRVISGYIYGGMKDIHKVWKSLKVFNENASSSYYVEADYKLDMDTTWTEIDGTFDTEPSKELEFNSNYPSARRLQYRVRIQSKYSDDTPDVEALIVDLFGVSDVHSSISFSTILEDDYVSRNVKGKFEKAWGGYNTALLAMDQAELWRNTGTALTLGSKDNLPDDKQVAINQIVYYRAGVEKEQVTSGAERWVVQFLCHEI